MRERGTAIVTFCRFVLPRLRALSLQSLSITQTVQPSLISKTNGGEWPPLNRKPPTPPPPRVGERGDWSALEDNLLNKSSPPSGWDSCADEIYFKRVAFCLFYEIFMDVARILRSFVYELEYDYVFYCIL